MIQPANLAQAGRTQLLSLLMKGVALDVKAYRVLHILLEEQFNAALRYRTAQLNELAGQIVATVETLELRRQQRVLLTEKLLGPGAAMVDAMALVTGSARPALESGWILLEKLVRDCKQSNTRNCNLIMDQQSIMQRVLHGEEETYAPV